MTLIGATTENPSFEVIRPLLSRCQVYVLKSLDKNDLLTLLHKAIAEDVVLKDKNIRLTETDAMLRYSGGDARKLLNILELVVSAEESDDIEILDEKVVERLQENPAAYDKGGEMHYDISPLLSSRSGVAIPMAPFTGSPVWWPGEKTLSLSHGGW